MKLVIPSSSFRAATSKVGLMLAFVLGQMSANTANSQTTTAPTDDTGLVIVSTDPVKQPSKLRKVLRGPVKPVTYPTKPQQPVMTLR